MKIKKEAKIGILVIVSLFVLIWGIGFLKGRNFLAKGNFYYGVYSRVEGLNEGSPIYYKGFKIGAVRRIEFHPSGDEFLVTLLLTKELPITNETVAQLYSVDLMGTKAIQFINYDKHSGNEVFLLPGDTLRTSVMGDLKDQVSTEVLPLKDKVENLIVKVDTVLTNIGGVFSDENKRGLSQAINSLYHTIYAMELSAAKLHEALNEGGSLHESLNNIEDFTETLSAQKSNLNSIVSNLKEVSAQFADADISGMVSRIDSAVYGINSVIDKVEAGDGSLGMFMQDKTLYLNLTDATANLDRLLADVRHHPERYVSFSAVNIGKKIYFNPDENLASEKDIVFKIKIAESKTPIDELRNKIVIDNIPIFEGYNGKNYIYTVGETHSYAKALDIADQLYSAYPSSSIIAMQDDKPISLKKALKKINTK